MSFAMQRNGRSVVVTIEPQLIVQNRQELKEKVVEALHEGATRFRLRFHPTVYIDASGLGVLVSLSKKIRDAGGELVIEGLNEDLVTLFHLTKIDTLFTLIDCAQPVDQYARVDGRSAR